MMQVFLMRPILGEVGEEPPNRLPADSGRGSRDSAVERAFAHPLQTAGRAATQRTSWICSPENRDNGWALPQSHRGSGPFDGKSCLFLIFQALPLFLTY